MLEDFCKDMGLVPPTGENAYVTALGQFDWIKETLNIPEVSYNDIMRLMETWVMGVPADEVCATICIVSLVVCARQAKSLYCGRVFRGRRAPRRI